MSKIENKRSKKEIILNPVCILLLIALLTLLLTAACSDSKNSEPFFPQRAQVIAMATETASSGWQSDPYLSIQYERLMRMGYSKNEIDRFVERIMQSVVVWIEHINQNSFYSSTAVVLNVKEDGSLIIITAAHSAKSATSLYTLKTFGQKDGSNYRIGGAWSPNGIIDLANQQLLKVDDPKKIILDDDWVVLHVIPIQPNENSTSPISPISNGDCRPTAVKESITASFPTILNLRDDDGLASTLVVGPSYLHGVATAGSSGGGVLIPCLEADLNGAGDQDAVLGLLLRGVVSRIYPGGVRAENYDPNKEFVFYSFPPPQEIEDARTYFGEPLPVDTYKLFKLSEYQDKYHFLDDLKTTNYLIIKLSYKILTGPQKYYSELMISEILNKFDDLEIIYENISNDQRSTPTAQESAKIQILISQIEQYSHAIIGFID